MLGKQARHALRLARRGKLVSRLYIEEGDEHRREIYLGFVMDRASERIVVVASAAGGMEIEEISASQPDTIIRVTVDPAVGMQQFQARELAFGLGVEPDIVNKLVPTIMGCYRAFRDLDATMVEINPLVITKEKSRRGARRQDVASTTTRCSAARTSRSCATRARKIRARPTPPTVALPMSASMATSAASSTARASRWRRST